MITGLPKPFWGMLSRPHLDWKVRKSRDREIKHLQSQLGKSFVDWSDFEVFMKRSFVTMLSARDARRRFERLRRTGSVKNNVRESMT